MTENATRRVVTTMPLLIDRAERKPGFVLDLPEAEAHAMVSEGRATWETDPQPEAGPHPADEPQPEPPAPPADQHEEH